jgi:hypothetical protein
LVLIFPIYLLRCYKSYAIEDTAIYNQTNHKKKT